MGDRMVIGFQSDKDTPPVWLYSHWGGHNRVSDLAEALKAARPRWNDSAYATRIAISQIIGDAWDRETGFGISVGGRNFTYPDYDDVHLVNWAERTVSVQTIDGEDIVIFGFEVFISAAPLESVYS